MVQLPSTAAASTCPLVSRVLGVARTQPGAPAIVGSNRTWTYRDLADEIEAVRGACLGLGPAIGTVVAIKNAGDERLAGQFLGARAAGLIPVLIDEFGDAGRTHAVLAASRPALVMKTVADGMISVSHASGDDAHEPRTLAPEAGYVVFTSGSTGAPKGIVGNARGVLSFLDWERSQFPAGSQVRGALLTSPAFDVVLRDVLLPLTSGGRLHAGGAGIRTNPRRVVPWLAEEGVELVHVVPSLGRRWAPEPGSLPNLRWVVFAGEPLRDGHVLQWRAAAPSARLLNLYGPSETTLAKFCSEVDDPPSPGLQPVGHPLPGTTLTLEPLADDADAGRVVITTPDGSLGYLEGTAAQGDAAALTRRDGVTRFVTADRGRWDASGRLVVLGRLDARVKRRGLFVDLAHIERMAETLPGVSAACCVQDPEDSRIVLWVSGQDEAVAGALRRRLVALMGAELPDEVRSIETLPLLPSGKPDRVALRARSAGGAPMTLEA